MIPVLLVITTVSGVLLLALLATELRAGRRTTIPADIAETALPPLPSPRSVPDALLRMRDSFAVAFVTTPDKLRAFAESALWLALVATLFDHLASAGSTTGQIAWYLTIGIHEIGHIICSPFGQLIYLLGGSVWQVLFWALIAAHYRFRYLRLRPALVCLAITGHSFINLARYIDDARTRKMPLLFNMDSSHHDWWQILDRVNLLPYDHLFAGSAVLAGVLLILGAVAMGVMVAWGFRFGLRPARPLERRRRF